MLIVMLAVVAWLAPGATPADPIRIAYIDPLSGPFAATGENGLNQFRFRSDADRDARRSGLAGSGRHARRSHSHCLHRSPLWAVCGDRRERAQPVPLQIGC